MKKITALLLICLLALLFCACGHGEAEEDNTVDTAVTEEPEAGTEEPASVHSMEADAEAAGIDVSYLQVINRTYPIPADYIAGTGTLMTIEDKQMETNAGIALEQMVAALRAEGMDIIVWSGYRTDGDQEYLYNRQIGRQDGNEIKAATISAVPLTSEHQAGLAIDLSIDGSLTDSFGETPQGIWLKEHCAEYGYILRYPAGKETVTGIISEPWHFRYVGAPQIAQSIMESGLCLEEYYGLYLSSEDINPYLQYLQ